MLRARDSLLWLTFGKIRVTLFPAMVATATTDWCFCFCRPSDGQAEQKVVEYAFKALDALGIKFGPTHTGV